MFVSCNVRIYSYNILCSACFRICAQKLFNRQTDYYKALADADILAKSPPFIEFMLQALLDALIEVFAKTSEKVSVKTSEKILVLVQGNPLITIAELARSIGVTERSIERNLKKLQAEQRLSRNGPANGGYWNVIK